MTEYIKAADMEPRRARRRHLNPKIRKELSGLWRESR